MGGIVRPSPSEALLYNINDTGRLAYICDLLLGLGGGGYGFSNNKSFPYISAGAANQDANEVSATPGNLVGFDAGNTATYWTYVKFYNVAAPTSGSGTPIRMFALPPGGGIRANDLNIPFSAFISFRITKNAAFNDATAVLAGDVVIGGIDYAN